MLDKYRVHNRFTLDFFDHYGSLFSLYDVMFFFFSEKKMFYRFEALNYNYVFNSLYGNYFVNFDVNLKFSLQILILSFMNYTPSNTYMSLRDLKYFKFLFKNGYSNFYKLNYLSLDKPYYSHDYFPLSLEDALSHDLYNIKSELSDLNLEISFESNSFYRIKETHPFDVDVSISSFTAYWSDLYSINTFGFIGKTQFSRLNFIVVNTYLIYRSFYVHFYEDSSYFSIQLLYMFFHFRQQRFDYLFSLGNLFFNILNTFNYNIVYPLLNFINSFFNYSFFNLFFYKFIFLFFDILKTFSFFIHIDLNYFYLFLQVNLFSFLSSVDLLNYNKFIFYFSLFFFKTIKKNNNFLLNLNLIKSFFYLTKSLKKNKFNKKLFSKTFLNIWNSSLLKKFKNFFFFFRFKKYLKVSLKSSYYVTYNYFKKTKTKKMHSYKYFNSFLNLKFLVKKPKFTSNFKNFNILFLSKMKYLNFISFYLILKSIINFDFLYNNDIQLNFLFLISRYFYLFYFFSSDLLNTYLVKFNNFKKLLINFPLNNYNKSFFYYNYYFFKIKLLFYFSFYSLHFSFLRLEKNYYLISNKNVIFNSYLNFSNLFFKFKKKPWLFKKINKNKTSLLKEKKNNLKMKKFSIIFNAINKKTLKIIFNVLRLVRFNASRILLLNHFLFEIDYLSFSYFGDTRYSFLFFGYNVYMNYLNKKFKFISNFKIKFKFFKFNSNEFLYIYNNRFLKSDLKLYNDKLLYNFRFAHYGFFMRKFTKWLIPYLKFSEYYFLKKKNFFFLSINFINSLKILNLITRDNELNNNLMRANRIKYFFKKYLILEYPILLLSLKSEINPTVWSEEKKKLKKRILYYLKFSIPKIDYKFIIKNNIDIPKDMKYFLKSKEYFSKNYTYSPDNLPLNYKKFLWFKYKFIKKFYKDYSLNLDILNYFMNNFNLKSKFYFLDNFFKINNLSFSSVLNFNNSFYNFLFSKYIFFGDYKFFPFLLLRKSNFYYLYKFNFTGHYLFKNNKFLSFLVKLNNYLYVSTLSDIMKFITSSYKNQVYLKFLFFFQKSNKNFWNFIFSYYFIFSLEYFITKRIRFSKYILNTRKYYNSIHFLSSKYLKYNKYFNEKKIKYFKNKILLFLETNKKYSILFYKRKLKYLKFYKFYKYFNSKNKKINKVFIFKLVWKKNYNRKLPKFFIFNSSSYLFLKNVLKKFLILPKRFNFSNIYYMKLNKKINLKNKYNKYNKQINLKNKKNIYNKQTNLKNKKFSKWNNFFK